RRFRRSWSQDRARSGPRPLRAPPRCYSPAACPSGRGSGPASPAQRPMTSLIRIGTRRSALALAQSGMMQRAIAAALGVAPEDAATAVPLVQIVTTGDRVQDRRLLEIGGKALFTKEIEEALLDG